LRFFHAIGLEERAQTAELLYRADDEILAKLVGSAVFETDRIGIIKLADHCEPWQENEMTPGEVSSID
jgi:hypothetical protein